MMEIKAVKTPERIIITPQSEIIEKYIIKTMTICS